MNRATALALGIVGAASLGAGAMYLYDPDRGALRRARARRKLKLASAWTAAKANDVAESALSGSKDLIDKARASSIVAAVLPAKRSKLERVLAPKSKTGQLAVVLLGTAIAATGSTLAARSFGGNAAAH
jgi:hypothetical protein